MQIFYISLEKDNNVYFLCKDFVSGQYAMSSIENAEIFYTQKAINNALRSAHINWAKQNSYVIKITELALNFIGNKQV